MVPCRKRVDNKNTRAARFPRGPRVETLSCTAGPQHENFSSTLLVLPSTCALLSQHMSQHKTFSNTRGSCSSSMPSSSSSSWSSSSSQTPPKDSLQLLRGPLLAPPRTLLLLALPRRPSERRSPLA